MRSSHLKSDLLRSRLHEIIFEADTPAGKAFDVALLVCILISVVTVSLESVASIRDEFGALLRAIEWILTALFTVEYFLRLCSVQRPSRYATSFFGLVDLLAVIPTYLSPLLQISVQRPSRYATSFFGLADLLAVIPLRI